MQLQLNHRTHRKSNERPHILTRQAAASMRCRRLTRACSRQNLQQPQPSPSAPCGIRRGRGKSSAPGFSADGGAVRQWRSKPRETNSQRVKRGVAERNSAPVLARISLQYSSRIHSLRRKGWIITNRVEIVNGVRHGFFKLGPHPFRAIANLRATSRNGRRDAETATG